MIAATLIMAMQSAQTPAPLLETARPATVFECSMLDVEGNRFLLSGTFPAVPAGWDPNREIPAHMGGIGAAELRGAVEMKPFHSTDDYRRFYVVKRRQAGGHYNMMFLLVKEDIGVVTVDRFMPATETGEGRLEAVATGDCESEFNASTGKNDAQ